MSEEVINFLKGFLKPNEEISGPILYAKKVLISERGNPEAAILEHPTLSEIRDVYCINTNERLLFVNVGIRSDSEVRNERVNLSTGIWEEEVGGRVVARISQGYVLDSIIKGRVFNFRFSSSLVAEAEFPVSQASPRILAILLLALGLLIMFVGILSNLSMFALGVVMGVLGIYFYYKRKLIIPSNIDALLKQSNTMVIVLQNIIPVSRLDKANEAREEEVKSVYKYLYLEIEFSETITAEEMSEFARALYR